MTPKRVPYLKPCPFCEKKGLFSFEIFGGVRVECSGCGARTKPETGDEKCDAYFSAAEKWNNGDIV
nr:Lar family restriction alleviation protein [Acutalibacter muris]